MPDSNDHISEELLGQTLEGLRKRAGFSLEEVTKRVQRLDGDLAKLEAGHGFFTVPLLWALLEIYSASDTEKSSIEELYMDTMEARYNYDVPRHNFKIKSPKGQQRELEDFAHLQLRLVKEMSDEAIFMCHSSGDKEQVRQLYRKLTADGLVCWLDEEELLPGQDWNLEIERALRKSRHVLVCLSQASVSKTGFVQKEIRRALDMADEQPEGAIYLIPVRLEECQIPDRLRPWQWVDIFEPSGYGRLVRVLKMAQSNTSRANLK